MENYNWADWLRAEREKQGLSIAELAKRAGTVRQVIYDYEMHKRSKPDAEILSSVSVSLGYSSRYLLIKAGILPADPENDEDLTKINELYNRLKDPESKKRAEDYLKLLLTQEEEKGNITNVAKPQIKPAKS